MNDIHNRNKLDRNSDHDKAEISQSKIEKRTYGIHQVANTIHIITRPAFKKQSPVNVHIMSDWVDIIGPHYGQITTPHRISNGTLTIACASTTATELQYIAQNIIQKINIYCGKQVIKKLNFLSKRTSLSKTPLRSQFSITAVEIKDLPSGPLQEALARLGGQLLARKKGKN